MLKLMPATGLKRDPHCSRCRLGATAEYVCLLGAGPKRCEVMIIGEAPGRREDDSGKPFVGRAGQYLDEMLEDAGFKRKDVFITNAVSCRPPDNRTPTKTEVKACSHWLQYQIKSIKPKYILLLGNVALLSITGETGIKKMRGKPFEKDGIIYLPTYHPSYILRGDYKDEPLFKNDLRLFKELSETGELPEEKQLNVKIVRDVKSYRAMLDDLQGTVSFDIETTGLYPWAKHVPRREKEKRKKGDPRDYDARLVSLGFGTRKHQWVINPLEFKLDKRRLSDIRDKLKEDCVVVGQYVKFDLLWMRVLYGVEFFVDFDTGIAHYLLDENSDHGLKSLAQRFCGAPNWDVEGEAKHEWSPRLIKYHAHDLYYTRELKFIFEKRLREDEQIYNVFRLVMMPCVHAFTDAEEEGVFIDESRMGAVEQKLKKDIVEAEKSLNKIASKYLRKGEDFNWGSPKQLGDLLFNRIKIKPTDKTKTGANSTAEGALKQMDNPLVSELLKLRGARQQLSFFIEGWKPYLVNGRLHPSFKLTGTVTGRLSCEHPNLQQVPRDPFIRTLITAPPGWVLIEADLSQIELRIAAELSGDRALLEAFETGKDPHWITALNELQRGRGELVRVLETASAIAGKKMTDYDAAIEFMLEKGSEAAIAADKASKKPIPQNKTWKELRKKAKAVNFGFLYGMGWRKFKIYAREKYEVILTDEQAQDSRKAFFSLYKDLPKWHERQRMFARRNGYVRMLSGRKRRLPAAMLEEDCFEKGEAERQAINSPVQGFANELNLMALVQLRSEFGRDIYRPVGTVHDSILAYAREDAAAKIIHRTLEVMRSPALLKKFGIKMRIPIDAEVSVGPWAAGIGSEKWLAENRHPTSSRSVSQKSRRGESAATRTTYGTSRRSRSDTRRDRSSLAA